MDNFLNLTALQPDMLVNLLKGAGSRLISAETLAADFAAGRTRDGPGRKRKTLRPAGGKSRCGDVT